MENSIELIKSRLSKATKGEWEFIDSDDDIMPIFESEGVKIMDFGNSLEFYPSEGTPPNKGDTEFIVNAKSDIEFLLNALENTKKQRDIWRNHAWGRDIE